ncbi:MAG: alanine--tRNA ligase [Candidatus Doudnabacteria bacterium]|nr:alanine--tRNA ligase [Candidatus Doudnabacteria bacterium]
MLTSKQIRQKFFEFWTSKERGHKEIPNASLVPVGDSTILFVNSGMFPLVPYLSGEPHPLGKRLVNFQRSLRTDSESIEEIGDNRHTLMFEMMGNWSLGDYFKAEQLPWVMELYHEVFGLDIQKLYVSVFAGDDAAPRDEESIEIWKKVYAKYGIEALVSDDPTDVQKNFDAAGNLIDTKKSYRIFTYPAKKNWWQRGNAAGELGGPDSEIFFDLGKQAEAYPDPELNINSDNGRFIEVGNSVFIQFKLDEALKWQTLAQKNVDFGGGFERVVMCLQGKNDIFETDIFMPIIERIESLTGKQYKTDSKENEWTKAFRVLADHGRVSTFILADGVVPSNKDQGYILRRFIRRLVRFGMTLGLEQNFTTEIANVVIENMSYAYPHLAEQAEKIKSELQKEEEKFRATLKSGLKEIQKLKDNKAAIDGKLLFTIYETYGFPMEMALEELGMKVEEGDKLFTEYREAELAHRAQSRAGAEQKFKGGLADQSEEVTKLHTAHHLLLAALQRLVDPNIRQRGSNITGERLRIDFNLDRKLTPEEIQQVEELVNQKIQEGLFVYGISMDKDKAESLGAQMEFGQKYPDRVLVYFITSIPPKDAKNGADVDVLGADKMLEIMKASFSMEFCGGPHVGNTAEIGAGGKKFKITKEESSGSGIRRIKASLV